MILRVFCHPVDHNAQRSSRISKGQRQMGNDMSLNTSFLGTGMTLNCQRDCDERQYVKKELQTMFQAWLVSLNHRRTERKMSETPSSREVDHPLKIYAAV
jgi:hypothetical protein